MGIYEDEREHVEDPDEKAFETWVAEVDAEFGRRYGLSVHDLPDQQFRTMFDDGAEPDEAADEIAENEEMN